MSSKVLGHTCIHDRLENRPVAAAATRSRVLYPKASDAEIENDNPGRHLATTATSSVRAKLRIHAEYVKQDGTSGADSNDATLVNKIQNDLMPKAIAFWQDALYTFSVQGALRFDRHCAPGLSYDMTQFASMNGNVYASTNHEVCVSVASPETCAAAHSSSQRVPDAWLNSREYCEQCWGDGYCYDGENTAESPLRSCSKATAGAGLAETDFALLVTVADTTECQSSPSAAAYAYTCRWDQYDRPILGYMNFCPTAMARMADDALKLLTIKHEMAHALGFNADNFKLMRERDGTTPRTAREGGGDIGAVPKTTTLTCADGSSKSDFAAPAESTLWRGEIVGRSISHAFKLATPTVVAAGREHFGCDTMNGVELENTPTTAGVCFGSHWEQRVLDGEAMAAQVTDASSSFSAITFAAFHDMGFYSVDFSKSDPRMVWGRDQGCTFLEDKCVAGSIPMLEDQGYFCTQENKERCAPDLRARSTCYTVDYREYGMTIPANMQYFSGDSSRGGSVLTRDYCPTYEPYETAYCENSDHQTAGVKNQAGETYGAGSRCIEGSLLKNDLSEPAGWSENQIKPACLMTSCVLNPEGGQRYVQISAKATDGAQVSAKCYDADAGNRKSMSGVLFKGTFVCPDIDLVCRSGPYATRFQLTCDTPAVAPEGYDLTGETGSRGIESFSVTGITCAAGWVGSVSASPCKHEDDVGTSASRAYDVSGCKKCGSANATLFCASENKEDCTLSDTECGACKTGFNADGQNCVDVCDAGAKSTCADANKENCSPGSTECGACKTGFKADGQNCVDVCDAGAKSTCADANKENCSPGSTACGPLKRCTHTEGQTGNAKACLCPGGEAGADADGTGANAAGRSSECREYQTCLSGSLGLANSDGSDAACSGVTCGDGEGVALSGGTTCRPATGDCDVEEQCNGASLACPVDAFKADASCTAQLSVDLDTMTTKFETQYALRQEYEQLESQIHSFLQISHKTIQALNTTGIAGRSKPLYEKMVTDWSKDRADADQFRDELKTIKDYLSGLNLVALDCEASVIECDYGLRAVQKLVEERNGFRETMDEIDAILEKVEDVSSTGSVGVQQLEDLRAKFDAEIKLIGTKLSNETDAEQHLLAPSPSSDKTPTSSTPSGSAASPSSSRSLENGVAPSPSSDKTSTSGSAASPSSSRSLENGVDTQGANKNSDRNADQDKSTNAGTGTNAGTDGTDTTGTNTGEGTGSTSNPVNTPDALSPSSTVAADTGKETKSWYDLWQDPEVFMLLLIVGIGSFLVGGALASGITLCCCVKCRMKAMEKLKNKRELSKHTGSTKVSPPPPAITSVDISHKSPEDEVDNLMKEADAAQKAHRAKQERRRSVSMDSMNARLAMRKKQMQLKLKRSKALEKVKLFSELNEDSMKALVNKMKLKSFNKGDCVCQEGEDASTFQIIVHVDDGACIRVTCAQNGDEEDEKELRRLDVFSYLGESALQEGGVRTASCHAWGGKVETLSLTKKAWSGLCTLGYVPDSVHKTLRKQATQNRKEQNSRTATEAVEDVHNNDAKEGEGSDDELVI
jgi:hypothetical protein